MMNQKALFLAAVLYFCVFLTACQEEPIPLAELEIGSTTFARPDSSGNWATIPDSVFIRGDDINLVLLAVSGFEIGADSLHHFEIDIEVTGPNKRVLFTQSELLGDSGHRLLTDGTVEFPCGTYTTMPEFVLGEYAMKLTIRDEVSGKQASRTRRFFLNK